MRVVLLGMNSPTGRVLEYDRRGSAGHRLFKLANMSPLEYEAAFERMNVLNSREWDDSSGARAAARLLKKFVEESRVVVAMGDKVWKSLGLTMVSWGGSVTRDGAKLYYIPHTSGRNLWYNDPRNRASVTRLLRRLARESGVVR